MPNHAHSTITITGPRKDREALKRLVQGDDNPFDLGKVIPMAKSLEVEAGSRSDEAMAIALYKDHGVSTGLEKMLKWPCHSGITDLASLCELLLKEQPNALEFGRQLLNNIEQYGAPTWYEWSYKNWGTKWNTYRHEAVRNNKDSLVYGFDTAWSEPRPVLEKLHELFPRLTIKVWVDGEVDEDYGYSLRGQEEE